MNLHRRPLFDQLQRAVDKAERLLLKLQAKRHPSQPMDDDERMALELLAMLVTIQVTIQEVTK